MDSWQVCLRPDPQAPLRIFCFPYAGGGASVFRRWATALAPGVEVRAVQYPGRESRLREPPFRRLKPMVEALVDVLRPALDRPFVFFGHSMGATVAYEVARRLRRDGGPLPLRLFVSARQAPHLPWEEQPMHDRPDAELREWLAKLGGTPEAVLQHNELMTLLMPLLRADFAIVETYQYEAGAPLDCPITALVGKEDSGTPRERMEGWAAHTSGGFEAQTLPGNHFFLHSAEEQVLQIVRDRLGFPGRMAAGARPSHPQPLSREGRGEQGVRHSQPVPAATRLDDIERSGSNGAIPQSWEDAHVAPSLAGDAIHVWRAALERADDEIAACEGVLSADERARADRFCFSRDRRHYIAGRGILRMLLGRYLQCDPASLSFRYNPQGKPKLDSPATDLRFNISHSHGVALYGLTRGRELGIDVEQVRGEVAVDQLAERFFSPREVAMLRQVPAAGRRDAFFRIWTRKEAYLKATGKGLTLALDCFDVSLTPGAAALLATRHDGAEAARWSMRDLAAGAGFAAALIAEGNGWRVWCGQWPGGTLIG
jgi:medium-chain acyl-[acyl-carrier-protein] hydrolase